MKDQYIAIDLKSFYASVECVERGLDPLTTNLVVADRSRTEKTICLAVSPSLKGYGVGGRPRLFEVIAKINEVNAARRWSAPGRRFHGATYDNRLLAEDGGLEIDYIVAPPRMSLYVDYSRRIYRVYLNFFSPDDIHVYSIDEVFIDATHYLKSYKKTARELSADLLRRVLYETGITATVGIGTNMYLAKVAMDIVAKRMRPDKNGVRIAELDEMSYRRVLWEHRPITDFWRVGPGYAEKLARRGIYTMGDIALTSMQNEELLYRLFGVNAELLIDHAWGYESCTVADIKAYRPSTKSLCSGQVLHSPYSIDSARVVLGEMCDSLVLDLVKKGLCARKISLTVGYDCESLGSGYIGETVIDHYGRALPKPAHGSFSLPRPSSSTEEIMARTLELYDRITEKNLLVRRLNISADLLIREEERDEFSPIRQLDLFTDPALLEEEEKMQKTRYSREKARQNALIDIKSRYGGNAIIKGASLTEGATAIDRNRQIGGHKA